MSDYIKYMYREYLEGRTRIKKVNEDQPLFPNTGAGLLIQKNKLTDDWTALNVSDGHYEEESFNHEALITALLIALLTLLSVSLSMFSRRNLSSISSETERVRAERIPSGRAVLHGLSIAERSCSRMYRSLISAMLPLVSSNRTNALAPFSLSTMISLKHLPPSLFCKILPLILIRPLRFSPCFC